MTKNHPKIGGRVWRQFACPKQWVEKGGVRPKKTRISKSRLKAMLIVFFEYPLWMVRTTLQPYRFLERLLWRSIRKFCKKLDWLVLLANSRNLITIPHAETISKSPKLFSMSTWRLSNCLATRNLPKHRVRKFEIILVLELLLVNCPEF